MGIAHTRLKRIDPFIRLSSHNPRKTFYTKNLKYAKEFFLDCLKKLYAAEGIDGIEAVFT